MDFAAIIGRVFGGHAVTIAGATVAVVLASEAVKPLMHVAQAVSNAVPS